MPATTLSPAANPRSDSKVPTLVVPFIRAAKEHLEQFVDTSVQLVTGTATPLGPFDLPAYGFVRGIILQINATGGVGAGVIAHEDAPWSVLDDVTVYDVNGAPIVGPLSGYDLYLVHKYGGYSGGQNDPKLSSAYSAVGASGGNFSFLLRIPIEVSARDGLGALANQNSAATYKLRATIASPSKVYTTPPGTTLPTVRVRAHLDAWTQPTDTDLRGNPNATLPPAHGTTSYWTKTVLNVSSGANTLRLPRIGNFIRELILVWRNNTPSRSGAVAAFADPLTINWDTRLLKSLPSAVFQHEMARKFDLTGTAEAARALDNGVYVEDYAHDFDGRVGYELRDGWLPTLQSTRLELTGSFGSAGTLTVLTNDISPAGEVFI